jgi:Family of unknown function (DUF5309)
MPATLLSGTGETSIQNVDNNIRDMDTPVYELEPSAAPLAVLMDAMGSKAARQPKVEWLEDEAMPRTTTVSAAAASGATTFGVAADIFRVGDVIKFPSLGFGLLVTTTGAGAITGTLLGTSVAAATGVEVFLIGNANAEFATLREIKFTQLVVPYNLCQIVRTPLGISETEEATEHYGGPERARLRKHFGIEHSRTLDDLFFNGVRSIAGTTRTMGGVTSYVVTNLIPDTGGLTRGDWETALRQTFRYGSGDRLALCSPIGMSAIEAFARSQTQVNDNVAERYGINMKTYVSGQGTVSLVMNRKWADSPTLGGYICLLDMADAGVQERPLRKTRLKPNVQTPSADGFQDEYITETCIQVKHERRHSIVTGITAPTG